MPSVLLIFHHLQILSKNNYNFKLEYENFKESLNKINNYFYKINEDNNIKNIVVDTTLIDSKNKYMNNYIYNAIVNYANYNYKKETKNIANAYYDTKSIKW